MPVDPPRTSLCIVRVEREGGAALVRVQRIPDLERPTQGSSDAAVDVDGALALVRAFLEQVLPSPRPGGSR